MYLGDGYKNWNYVVDILYWSTLINIHKIYITKTSYYLNT